MSFNNKNMLPNTSAPWGREVEQRVERLEAESSRSVRDASNGLSGVSNNLESLARTVKRLQESKSFHTFPVSVTNGLPIVFQYTGTIPVPLWATMATVTASTAHMRGAITPSSPNTSGGLVVGNAVYGAGESTWSDKIFDYNEVRSDPYRTFAMSAIVDVSASREIWFGGTLSSSGTGTLEFDVVFSIDWA